MLSHFMSPSTSTSTSTSISSFSNCFFAVRMMEFITDFLSRLHLSLPTHHQFAILISALKICSIPHLPPPPSSPPPFSRPLSPILSHGLSSLSLSLSLLLISITVSHHCLYYCPLSCHLCSHPPSYVSVGFSDGVSAHDETIFLALGNAIPEGRTVYVLVR